MPLAQNEMSAFSDTAPSCHRGELEPRGSKRSLAGFGSFDSSISAKELD